MIRAGLWLALLTITGVALQAQTVVSTNPSLNDESVPRNTDVAATFSTTMQNASASNFVVRGGERGTRTGVYSGGGTDTLGFDPDTDFGPNEQLFVSLTTGLQTTGSQQLSSPYVYRIRGEAGWGPRDYSAYAQNLGYSNSEIVRAGDMNGDGSTDIVLGSVGGQNSDRKSVV